MMWVWVLLLFLGYIGAETEEDATVESVPDGVESIGGVWGKASSNPSPIATLVGGGGLQGSMGMARSGKEYLQFFGIPYAAPPTGERRFMPPAPMAAWDGVRDATVKPSICTQQEIVDKKVTLVGGEDCLYLNVFTRSLTPDIKRPVFVYIHGGAFVFGRTTNMTGEFMMEQDMVFVTLQYRLGPMGFLSTEDATAPGNMGLHDQISALQWVQANIAQFGGDPSMVTLAGLSAGGASVNYLLLSPLTDGLFHRAVLQSGSALCWWANLPNQKKTATSLGELLDCPAAPSSELLSCLKKKKVEDIMEAQNSLYRWHPGTIEAEPMNIWSPRSDPEAGKDSILPIPAEMAMEVGQIQPVPVLVGVAESEGAWRGAYYLTQDHVMQDFIQNFKTVAPLTLGLEQQVNEGQMKPVLAKIRDYYLGALTTETDLKVRLERMVIGMVNMLGDSMFNYPIDRMVKLQANKPHSPVWMYEYNFKHEHSLVYLGEAKQKVKFDKELDNLRRSTHGQEMSMMFPIFLDPLGPLSEQEVKQSIKFVKFLYEFAVRGHPKQDGKYEFKDWKEIMDGQLTYFVFGKYSGSQNGLPFQHRMKWWNSLPVYWKKDSAPALPIEDLEDLGSRYAENVEEISEESERLFAEELTSEELEELEVVKVIDQMKEEL